MATRQGALLVCFGRRPQRLEGYAPKSALVPNEGWSAGQHKSSFHEGLVAGRQESPAKKSPASSAAVLKRIRVALLPVDYNIEGN